MRIYTRTGDEGQTGLLGGGRVSKTDARISAIGDVDELNACLGLVRSAAPEFFPDLLSRLQSGLFNLGAELAAPPEGDFHPEGPAPSLTEELERSMDEQTAQLPPLKNFILPGGTETAARLHHARAVCRRAERSVLILHGVSAVSSESRVFINRLSDWLFVTARTANASAGRDDEVWRGTQS